VIARQANKTLAQKDLLSSTDVAYLSDQSEVESKGVFCFPSGAHFAPLEDLRWKEIGRTRSLKSGQS
jgi:hypothetical protein